MKLRVYFNDAGDPATIWSFDNGPGTEERYCGRVNFMGVDAMRTVYDIESYPSAWIECSDVRVQLKGDLLVITNR